MRKYMAFVMLVVSSVAWAQVQSMAVPRLLRAEGLPIEVEPIALQRQYNALQAMQLSRLEYSPYGPVHQIAGDTGLVLPQNVMSLKEGDSTAQSTGQVLQVLKDLLLAEGTETLIVTRNGFSATSKRTLRFSQSIRGIPVIGGGLAIGYDPDTRRVSKMSANFLPDHRSLPRAPKLSARAAEQVIALVLAVAIKDGAREFEIAGGTYLAYYMVPAEPTHPKLVWAVRVEVERGIYELFLVDALTGIIADRLPETSQLTRIVYNADNSSPSIPNGLTQEMELSSSEIAADSEANEAHIDVATAARAWPRGPG
ncbi:MAG: hypothetical protein AB7P44_04175 [Steroidobacteraceae bacterium]